MKYIAQIKTDDCKVVINKTNNNYQFEIYGERLYKFNLTEKELLDVYNKLNEELPQFIEYQKAQGTA